MCTDDILYLCAGDRQGIIQSNGVSITKEISRFVLCLLYFHHFKKYPDFDLTKLFQPPVEETDLKNPCLSKSRATSEIEPVNDEMVRTPKISTPEIQRPPGVNPIEVHCAYSDRSDQSPFNGLPSSVHAFHSSLCLQAQNALREQRASDILWKRRRILRVVVSEELVPLTSQTGKSFVEAWLEAVTCAFTADLLPLDRLHLYQLIYFLGHSFIRKHGIGHSDPSLWNAKYHRTRKCGILTDFDLSVTAWLTFVPRTDRTGTVPFMAMELLCDGNWKKNNARHYCHELEAFIWMLPCVFLAYSDGKYVPQTRFIEDWMTPDYNACGEKKNYFLYFELVKASALVKPAFNDYRALMARACFALVGPFNARQGRVLRHAWVKSLSGTLYRRLRGCVGWICRCFIDAGHRHNQAPQAPACLRPYLQPRFIQGNTGYL